MSFMQAVLILIRARFLIWRNTFWRGKIGRKIGWVVMVVVLAFGAYGLYWLMTLAVRVITSPDFLELLHQAAAQSPGQSFPTDFMPYLLVLPSLVLFLALVLLIFTSFTSVLSSLYLSGDIDMLLVAPVPMRAVFVVKFFDGLIIPYLLLFFLLGPALFGYGQGMGFGAAFFICAVLVLMLLPLLPAGVGALLVMAVVRVIPARRAREIVGVLGGLLGASWYVLNQLSASIAPRIVNIRTFETLRQLDLPVLPSAWAGRALIAAGQGEWLTLLIYGGLFVALALGIFSGCLLLAERLYYVGWSNMATQGGRVRGARRRDPKAISAQESYLPRYLLPFTFFLPVGSQAIIYKDLRVFPRDLRNLQQLIFPLALGGIWTFQLLSGRAPSGNPRPAEFQQFFSNLGSAGISFFICLSLSGVLGGTGVSREGKGFWLIKVAPLRSWQLLISKWILAYLPFPLVGTLLVVAFSIVQQSTFLDFLRSFALMLLLGAGTSGISLGLGAAFPRLNWENPQQQTSARAGCLIPILYMLYIGMALAFVFGLPAMSVFAPQFALPLAISGWLLLLALTVGLVWGLLALGASRLERVE